MQGEILNLLGARRGHFLIESGHHGNLWLDLETLCLRPRLLRPYVAELAHRLSKHDIEHVCAPLVEGAFVGLMVAAELGVAFSYAERFARPTEDGLFPAGYRIPAVLRPCVRKKRVAVVNDVINAGSALRGTFEDLRACEAEIMVIGTLLALGTAAKEFARMNNVELETLATLPNALWTESGCPLCSAGVPLEDVGEFRVTLADQS
jgi:orotate phosphoribosyltransferase